MSAPVDSLPEVALAPDQAPESVQEVALVEDQVSVEDAPYATAVGFATSETVGSGGVTPPGVCPPPSPPPPPPQPERPMLASNAANAKSTCFDKTILPVTGDTDIFKSLAGRT